MSDNYPNLSLLWDIIVKDSLLVNDDYPFPETNLELWYERTLGDYSYLQVADSFVSTLTIGEVMKMLVHGEYELPHRKGWLEFCDVYGIMYNEIDNLEG